jgi:hypothetical protein
LERFSTFITMSLFMVQLAERIGHGAEGMARYELRPG